MVVVVLKVNGGKDSKYFDRVYLYNDFFIPPVIARSEVRATRQSLAKDGKFLGAEVADNVVTFLKYTRRP